MYKSLQKDHRTLNSISLTYGNQPELSEAHSHDFDEIVIVLSGNGIQHINGKKYIVSAGDIFLIKSYDLHHFSDTNKMYIFNIGYKTEFFSKYKVFIQKIKCFDEFFLPENQSMPLKNKIHLNAKELSEMSEFLNALSSEYISQNIGCELMVTSYFLQIIVYICRAFEKNFQNETKIYNSYEGAISYIENNYTERITLKTLCTIAGVTPNALINFFKKNFGMTPVEYINSVRIGKACELLRKKQFNITYIATETGFPDINYFSRTFKKHLGISPSYYRKKYQDVN